MRLHPTRFGKILLAIVLFVSVNNSSKAQTTLVTGDLAFTGYISNDPVLPDQFSFVLLTPITNTTVIKFTDFGWRTDLNAFSSGSNLESEITFTANAGYPAGTEITIAGANATLVGGATAGAVVYTTGAAFLVGNLSLSSSGDQLFAYQGTFASPTFISGIHMNVYAAASGDPTTTDAANWDGVLPPLNIIANTSGKPAALTTGTNAIWIGTVNVSASEEDNGHFNCTGPLVTAANVRAAVNNPANWITNDGPSAGFTLPTGCNYMNVLSAPIISVDPSNTTICQGANTSFSVTASGATGYQWQVSTDGGVTYNNLLNGGVYSNVTASTLNLTAVPASYNNYRYRVIVSNGSGSVTSNPATLTVTALPVNPTLLLKTPTTASVSDGTNVSATFNAGSGGNGPCTDDYRYTTNGGVSYLPYTPGTNISTTGIAAGSGFVFIEGRRGGCTTCSGNYVVLASWFVTPLPAGATTLAAGDIAFSGYTSQTPGDDFSFVLLKNIGTGTAINFTDNGWLSTNVFRSGEQNITWTSNASYPAGTEIKISGTTATLASGGSAGTVTGTALSLSTTGDQILAFQGAVGSPTFISAIHMNVYVGPGDPSTTTAAAWDGTANTTNASALPTGLTTGVNAIWIGTQGVPASEFENSHYGNCSGPGTLGPITALRAALNNQANWISDNGAPGFVLPTGCPYLSIGAPPTISADPTSTSVCEGANSSFTVTASGATSYQWQVDNGGGFANITNNATYSGATTATLSINATPLGLNGFSYRVIAINGSGSVTSAAAILTVNALPVSPTVATKTPASIVVADGTNVSATFNAGTGGTGCADDFRYTIDGGVTYLPYTPGTNISTTGLAAGSGHVFIEGRRANCSAGCQGSYTVLALWRVSPLPVAATTLNAGDIAFSGYTSTSPGDDFSFVLLRNIGPGTTINFTDNGWLSTNVLQSGEQTITWTAPAGGLYAGTEINIAGLTATKSGGGAAGTVTGTALSLSSTGDQVLAYRGTAASPTFISAIHMNVYNAASGDPVTTTAAAWDGTANTQNSSALPTGLTTGVNAIWIGTQGVPSSEYNNARYGNCSGPGVLGPLTGLRAALNNQANWIRDNNTPPAFGMPSGCNYLSVLCPTITVTNPGTATGTAGTAFSQTFTAAGGTAPYSFTTVSTLPTGLTLSTGGVLSGTPTQSGTFPIVVTAADAGGCSGNGATYTLVIGCPTNTVIATPASQTICSGATITTIVLSGGLAGTTYSWVRDNNATVTGITASGTGDISGALTNTTASPVTVTFTITPQLYGCNGTPTTATVLVNPTPDAVATPSSQSVCSGGTITTIALTGSVGSTTFNWTRDNTGTVTGIAGTGAGDISGTLTNTTNAPITVTFTITPSTVNCSGTPITATVVVNPIPTVTATPASQARCSGATIQPIIMSGTVSGTSFDWVRDNVGTIGGTIPASGSGNISGNLVNNTGSPVTVTFTITPNANGCPGTPVTATITVNPLPLATIQNYGYFCQDSAILNAVTDPNYTYQWGVSLFTTPFTNLGTASTQTFYNSGNVLLTVTNQYGCVDTAMNTVNISDYTFNGSIAPGDAVQTGRMNRFAVISTCAAPKAYPGSFTTVGNRAYDSYTVTNIRNVPVCARIGVNSFCATNIFSAAYLTSFNPANIAQNYLGDPGSSFTQSGFYEVTIPANGTIVVVVHEVNSNTGCAGYRLTVNVPRDPEAIVATPDANVCGGNPITLTASVANTYLWTPGGATTQAISVNTPNTYDVRLGYGNNGCNTHVQQVVTAGTVPVITPVANQYYCKDATAPLTPLTGGDPGTVYTWTNTNTSIGLAASGTGDIPSFTATNTTGAPISGTITVNAVNGGCSATPITFTITVLNEASITSVTDDDVCYPGGVVNLAAAGTGTINWYDALTGGNLVNTGTTFNPNISTTTTYYVESRVTAPPPQAVTLPAQSNTFPGNVRGYWFTAPVNFTMTSLIIPTTASAGAQSVAVVKFNGNTPPPVFSATTNAFTTLFLLQNGAAAPTSIPVNIQINAGEVIGILGYRGAVNSYCPGDQTINIGGINVQAERLGMQFNLNTTAPRDIWREFGATTSLSRVNFEYTVGKVCTSSPRVPVTGTVLPDIAATATPSSQTICSANPITTIVITNSVPGTSFDWTRDNTGTVTGIAGSGNGDISGTLTNTTNAPVTVTFTIIPTANGCSGTPITATVLVNPTPNAVATPSSQTICSAATITTIVLSGNVATTSFDWTRDNTGTVTGIAGSGSGDISGALTNTTNAPVTVTFTITPTANGCPGTPITATVVVNPTPNAVATPASQTICSANPITTIVITGNVASTTFNWVRDNTGNVTGINPSGSGDISGTLTNTTNTPQTVTFTITPIANGCPGTPITATVLVNPTPNAVATPSSQVSCGGPITTIVLTGNVAGTTFNWIRDNTTTVTGIGGTSGTGSGDISGTLTNTTNATIVVTFTITPIANGCPGTPITATVTVNATPTITCPANIAVNNDPNVCGATVTYAPIVTGVPVPSLTYTFTGATTGSGAGTGSGSVFGIGVTTVTLTATNSCNTVTCSFTVTVTDTQIPVITCPAPVTVSCASSVPAPAPGTVTVTDNCPGATVAFVSDVISNQSCANRYTITRTYRATDASGNTAVCTQTITVNDQTPPTLTCPGPITVSCASAVPAPNTALVIGVSDNCSGAVTVTHISDVISNQTCPNRYTITRTYRATDACGNFTNCTQTITVNDVTAPVITCPAPLTVSCASAVPDPDITSVTATDGCGGPITITFVSDVISAQTCVNRFIVTRTYRATDACGNSSTCTQTITVNDVTAPVITCPAPLTVSCASAVPAANPASLTVSDNCAGAVTVIFVSDVISAQTCVNRYTITRTYRATDACGNTATCTQTITVNDVTAPVITCPAQVLVSCASAVPAANPASVTATDNCGGGVTVTHVGDVISNQTCANRYTITRTYRATDACGNFSECTQIISVNDQTAPVVTCPANITVTAPVGVCTSVVTFTPTATDGCGGAVTITSSPASGTAFPVGTTVVTTTATDACGNVSTCTFTVTVNDARPPIITTQPVSVTGCIGGNASFTVVATNAVGFQWQVFNGTTFVNIPGATSATLPLNNILAGMLGNRYRVVVSSQCSSVNSNEVILNLFPLATVVIVPSPPIIAPTQVSTFIAVGNNLPGTYTWFYNGNVIPGANASTLGPLGVLNLGTYKVQYTDRNGCVAVSPDQTLTALISHIVYVFPNPNNGHFQVKFYSTVPNQPVTVKVSTILGQPVFSKQYTTTSPYSVLDVDISSKPAGTYHVEVFDAAGHRIGVGAIPVIVIH